MPKAKTVIDVILGEAVSGTREERYADMLAIASVIDNRANMLGASHQDVVANSNEFNAFGDDIPDGAEHFRELAEQAMEEVRTSGPINHATFYATPATLRNLPDGLEFFHETKGHRFGYDPQYRSIGTAKGYMRPKFRLGQFAGKDIPTPVPRPGGLLDDLGGNEPPQSGGAAESHSAHESQQQDIDGIVILDNAGRDRDRPITDSMRTFLATAVREVYGPGFTAKVYSGGQYPEGLGKRAEGSSPRHDHGKAADVHIFDPDGKQVRGDGLAPLGQYWAAKKIGGVGLEMKGGGIHLDEWSTPPPGGAMFWDYDNSDDGGRFTPAQQRAMRDGLAGKMPELAGASEQIAWPIPVPRPRAPSEVPGRAHGPGEVSPDSGDPLDQPGVIEDGKTGVPDPSFTTLPPEIDPSTGKEFYQDPDLPLPGAEAGLGSIFLDPAWTSAQPGKGGRLVEPGKGGRLIGPTKGGLPGTSEMPFMTLPPEIDFSRNREFQQDPNLPGPEAFGDVPTIFSDIGLSPALTEAGRPAPLPSPRIAPPVGPVREGEIEAAIPIPQSRPVLQPDSGFGETDRTGMHDPRGNGIGGLLGRSVGGLLGSLMDSPAGVAIGGLLGGRLSENPGERNSSRSSRRSRNPSPQSMAAPHTTRSPSRRKEQGGLSDRAREAVSRGRGGLY